MKRVVAGKSQRKIDYNKYYGDSGINTRFWGCRLWDSLFVSIIGRYPIRIKTSDDIEIKHTAHSRSGFAMGAVVAAEWLQNKKGFFTMNDLIGF